MAYYRTEDIDILAADFATVVSRNMAVRFLRLDFSNTTAKEFALHGVCHRMKTLTACISNTFELVPPELGTLPTRRKLDDTEIQVQAFVINVFGVLDNIAWVWVKERNLSQSNGAEINAQWVGLRPSNTLVRNSFSDPFKNFLNEMGEWFEYIENYRHSLAHRIPLYIPPHAITPQNADRYNELESEIFQRTFQGEFDAVDALRSEQERSMFFRPFIIHSFERSRPVPFHVQMLADFKTVETIAHRFLDELSAEPRS